MNLEKLNYLLVLMEEQNVTKAAKRLFITQPTLTTYLNRLEQELGFRIFDRTQNPVRVTREGRLYISRMNEILLEEQKLVDDLQKMALVKKEFRIGIGQINSEIKTPTLVEELLKRHRFLDVTVREGAEMRILEDLKEDRIDLMFGHITLDTVNFMFEEVETQRLAIMIPENLLDPYALYPEDETKKAGATEVPDFPASSPDHLIGISPDLLSNMPIIEPGESQGLYLNLKTLLSTYHLHPIRTIRTGNMIAAASMLKRGLGYFYGPPQLLQYAQAEDEKRILFCTLPKLKTDRKYYGIYKKDNPNREYIREAIEIVCAHGKKKGAEI